MKWRRVDSGEVAAFAAGKTVQIGRMTDDHDPAYVVYTVIFTDGTAYRSKHTSTPDGILNEYEVGEPERTLRAD